MLNTFKNFYAICALIFVCTLCITPCVASVAPGDVEFPPNGTGK